MINFLLGAPGGGKSYEAVVFHILVALQKGRKVITNLALLVDAFVAMEPGYASLIELRTETLAPKAPKVSGPAYGPKRGTGLVRAASRVAFSQLEDYGDTWRHPVTGAGPLYVIDECHLSLPKIGTPVPVEEWFSLHRHEFADVLLISQGYGKVNAAVRDLIQIVYRVRKNIAFGSSKSYTRKVQDGVRGVVVNTAVRRYEVRYFSLYRSHTRSAAGIEMGAVDIIPVWRHWTINGIGLCVLLFAFLWFRNGSPFAMFTPKKSAAAGLGVARAEPGMVPPGVPGVPGRAQEVVAVKGDGPGGARSGEWPYGALELHVGGVLRSVRKVIVLVVFSQNGQKVFDQTGADLVQAGYKLTVLNDCLVRVQYGQLSQFIACDSPSVGIGSAYSKLVPQRTAASDPAPVKR